MQPSSLSLTTPRLVLSTPEPGDAGAMLDYYQRNRPGFQPWEPARKESFYSVDGMRARIALMNEKMLEKHALHFVFRAPGSARMIGECGFTNIVHGPFQACHLGFSMCGEFQGQGLMSEGLRCAIDYVFGELGLHRVMANYRPENERSHRLLARLGFEQEGRARSYLKINGQWTDHILTSLINGES